MQNLVSLNQDNQEQSENSFSFIQQRNFTNKLDEIFDNLVFTLSHEKYNFLILDKT